MVQTCCCVSDNNATVLPTGGVLCSPELKTKLVRARLATALLPVADDIPVLNALIANNDAAGAAAWLNDKVKPLIDDSDAFQDDTEGGVNIALWLTTAINGSGAGIAEDYFARTSNSPPAGEIIPSGPITAFAEGIVTAPQSEQIPLLGKTLPDLAFVVAIRLGAHAVMQIRTVAVRDPDFNPCPEPDPTPSPCPTDDECSEDDVCFVPKRCGASWQLLF